MAKKVKKGTKKAEALESLQKKIEKVRAELDALKLERRNLINS